MESILDLFLRIRNRLFTLLLSSLFMEIGVGCRIVPPFRFKGLRGVSLGEKVIIHRDCWVHTLGEKVERANPKLIIKSHSAIGMGATISAAQQVVIGEHVLLARNVFISDHAHAFENISIPIMDQGINHIAPVIIGNSTWLGQNVVVLPGVTIGEHCVIGANSVVISSIPDHCVAVGAPARVVKRFNQKSGTWDRVV
jgi:acetyltransferase-like isoleucine patch superfamily enzyme